MRYFLTFFLAASSLCGYARTVNVVDFGAKTNSKIDCTAAVAAAVKVLQSGDTLIFPTGRYDFFAANAAKWNYYESNTTDILPKHLAVQLRGLNDIVLDAKNSIWVMHGAMQPLTIDSCVNVKVENLRVDWDHPLSAQGLVSSVTDSGFFVVIDRSEFPYTIQNEKIVFAAEGWSSTIFSIMEFTTYGELPVIEPSTGDATSWGYTGYKVYEAENSVFFKINAPTDHMPKAGNSVVLRHNARAHAGIFVIKSSDVAFSNTWLHHTGGLGILCQYSENLTFTNSGVVPNPDKRRVLSGHDDGFHIMGCRGEILVESCRWQGLMDDPINIHGTAAKIIQISGKKLLCRFMEKQSVGMEWGQNGNHVAFLDNTTLATVDKNIIKSYKQISITDFEVELAFSLPRHVHAGFALENLHWRPSSITVRGSTFGGGRARGLLVSAPGKIVIEGNTFYSSGAAILIAGDANGWYETGAVQDVLIKGNKFMPPCNTSYYQFGNAIISIDPEISNVDEKKPFHRNIRIVGNEFYTANKAIVYAKSVRGLVIKGNKIERSASYAAPIHEVAQVLTVIGCSNMKSDI